MPAGRANCLVCGEPLRYAPEARTLVCSVCGGSFEANASCAFGHYVCDACHRRKGVEHIMELCRRSSAQNPVDIFIEAAGDASVNPNGPEHHTLVGAALLCAYANSGGAIDKRGALAELASRSAQVPGGTCGFWGCCGAAVSAGQALSVICGATPLAREEWGLCQRLTSNILGKLADIGGPRCCKRTGFTALLESIDYIAETQGVRMQRPENIVCSFHRNNPECIKMECPYFPGHFSADERKRAGALRARSES